MNCDAYNPSNSKVVKSSKTLRDRLLEEVRIVTGYQYGALINLSKTTTTTTTSSSAASGRVNKREIRMRIETFERVLDLVQAEDTNNFFSVPVTDDIAPGYSDIVLTPMDLTTLRNSLESHVNIVSWKRAVESFTDTLDLIFRNARAYNRPGDIVYVSVRFFSILPFLYRKHTKTGTILRQSCNWLRQGLLRS